jgi:mono/diheme cytochrome c family protein
VTLAGALLLTLAAIRQSEELAPGAGRELVVTACTGCHTAEIIVSSHMSRKTWETTLDWMSETQGMVPLEPAVREAILDYLEMTQGLEGDEDSGETSPWASPRYRPNPLWKR